MNIIREIFIKSWNIFMLSRVNDFPMYKQRWKNSCKTAQWQIFSIFTTILLLLLKIQIRLLIEHHLLLHQIIIILFSSSRSIFRLISNFEKFRTPSSLLVRPSCPPASLVAQLVRLVPNRVQTSGLPAGPARPARPALWPSGPLRSRLWIWLAYYSIICFNRVNYF